MLPFAVIRENRILLFIISAVIINYEAGGLENLTIMMKTNDVQGPPQMDRTKALVGDLFETDFSVAHPERCKSSVDYSIFVFVISAPRHFAQREVIRDAAGRFGIDATSLVSFAFLVGKVGDKQTNGLLETEDGTYGDLVRTNNLDTYDNLTLKVCSMLAWIHQFCRSADFIIKSDDDVFINYENLLQFISVNFRTKRKMYGKVGRSVQTDRRKGSKYFIPYDDYKPKTYPTFLLGSAYLFTGDIAYELLINTLYHTFFRLEDVLITGFVADKLKIGRESIGTIKDRSVLKSKLSWKDISKSVMIFNIKLEEYLNILSLVRPAPKISSQP